jgi:hypothetical protein
MALFAAPTVITMSYDDLPVLTKETMYTESSRPDEVVTLNVGGEKFVQTTRRTLTCVPDSKLAAMFSGRWDESIAKDKDGNYFIDFEPALFLPLLGFLRGVSAMPVSEHIHVTPPVTPSFRSAQEETAFRRMVDSFALTNAVYSYDVYVLGETCSSRFRRDKVSADQGLLHFVMHGHADESNQEYSLDRPRCKHVDSHERGVQAFEINVFDPANVKVNIGWSNRKFVLARDYSTVDKYNPICVRLKNGNLEFIHVDQYKKLRVLAVLRSPALNKASAIVRCSKQLDTGELEWFVDGKLIASTSLANERDQYTYQRDANHSPEYFNHIPERVLMVGWSVPDSCELIPYIDVRNGDCQVASIELET